MHAFNPSYLGSKRIASLRTVQAMVERPCFKNKTRLGVMAYACNPSYSGSRDWKDHCSKPVWAKISQDLKTPNKLGRICLPFKLSKRHK
jgi:hypothetical protein